MMTRKTITLEMVDKTIRTIAATAGINQERIEGNSKQYANNKKFLATPPYESDNNLEEDEEFIRENLFLRDSENVTTNNDGDDESTVPLAWAPTTPYWTIWGIPMIAIGIHALFLYGQIEPMWRLHQSQNVDVWFNATTEITSEIYEALNLTDNHFELSLHEESTIQSFTYGFAIRELWEANGLPSKSTARLAAILLMISSGVWPHLKLLLLNWTWLRMRNPKRRKKFLYWLSRLGKWSLADILVVCIMIGIIHVDWYVDPEAIRDGIGQNFPYLLKLLTNRFTPERICLNIMPSDCLYDPTFNCNTCIEAIRNPDDTGSIGRMILLKGISAGGDGLIQLQIVGMRGVYAFCIAIILSILLSVVVDILDHKASSSNFAFLQIIPTTIIQSEEAEEEEDGILLSSLSLKDSQDALAASCATSKDENRDSPSPTKIKTDGHSLNEEDA